MKEGGGGAGGVWAYSFLNNQVMGYYLHDNTVASSKGRAQFPGSHENGEVPGDDLTHHPQGLLVNGGLHLA